jgi:thiosulfate/3-mercaptopyruvate sulfurtransferase
MLALAVSAMNGLAASAPRQAFPEPELLLEPSELARPETAERFVVLDVRSKEDYHRGHIPRAQRIDHDGWKDAFEKESREDWGRRIGELGIGKDSQVVVYDDTGMKKAGRIWWILRYWGVADARLLNGGWREWTAKELPVSQEAPEVKAVEFSAEPQDEWLATKDDVLAMIRNPGWQIVDARSRNEHCGIDSGTNLKGGAIPGAKHLEWSDLIDQQTHRFKSPEELRRLFERAGIELNRPIATHCQSGGRAATMAFGLELMGAEDVRNYYQGWSEWGNDKKTPVVVPDEGKEEATE